MSTPRTIEITIPDNYTADEVREHLARLPVKRGAPGTVAFFARYPNATQVYWRALSKLERERWAATEQACREGYVEKDKIEAALVERVAVSLNADREFKDGFYHGWHNLARLIREALK